MAKPYLAGISSPAPYTAPSGQWQYPSNLLGSVPGACTPGVVYFCPLDVGPVPVSYQSLGVGVTTAQVGGTTTSTLGLYKDNGSGGLPNLVGGPLYSGTVTLTATGNQFSALTMTNLLGRYWMAFLYFESVAATTKPSLNMITNSSPAMWLASSITIGTSSRALQVTATAQTALPTTQVAITPVGGSQAAVIAARAA